MRRLNLIRYYLLKEKLRYIPNFVDLPLAMQEYSKYIDLPDKYFLVVSNISQRKNLEYTINVFYHLHMYSKTKLVICGLVNDKRYMQRLNSLILSLNLKEHVIFTGHVRNIVPVFNNALFLLHFSLNEGFPNSVAQSVYYNTPVGCFTSIGETCTLASFHPSSVIANKTDSPYTIAKKILDKVSLSVSRTSPEFFSRYSKKKITNYYHAEFSDLVQE